MSKQKVRKDDKNKTIGDCMYWLKKRSLFWEVLRGKTRNVGWMRLQRMVLSSDFMSWHICLYAMQG